MNDCTVIPYNGFKERLRKHKELEQEMIKKYGRNKSDEWRYTVSVLENCIMAEHISDRAYF